MLGRKRYTSPRQQSLRAGGDVCDDVDTGVLCASEIPSGFLLGSLQGELRLGDGLKDERTSPYMLQIKHVDGKIVTADEDNEGDNVRWMRFISAARNDAEQNTEAATNSSGQVVLRTTRRVLIGEELLVWYSDKLQRIMNILPVLPSRDRSGQLRYICQFCCKSFRHPNTLKSHLRFNCVNDSLSSSMLLSSCQPIPRPKNAFDIGLGIPLQWPTKSSHYLGSRFDISLLRSLANTMAHGESSTGFRAFKPITKCSERRASAFKAHQENDSSIVDTLRKMQMSSPELETQFPLIKSTLSPSSYDLASRLHPQLLNCSVPSLNISSTQFGAAPFRSHINAPSCVLYGCACYYRRHLDIHTPIDSLPHHQHPFDCRLSGDDHRPSSSTDATRRWPFHTILPFPADSVVGAAASKDRQNPPPDQPHLILPNASQQSMKGRRGHMCIYCGKFYSRKYGLKIHLRTHTGYKPLKCKVCLRPFGDPSNLNKHIRLHAEGETPYRCEFCGKVLVRRRDLERHIKSRHPTEISPNKDDELINVDDISSSSLLCDNDSDEEQTLSKDSAETNSCHEIENMV